MIKIITSIFLIVISSSKVLANNNFVRIKLPHDVQIEIPKNWVVINQLKRVTIDSAAQSQVENIVGEYSSNFGRVDEIINK